MHEFIERLLRTTAGCWHDDCKAAKDRAEEGPRTETKQLARGDVRGAIKNLDQQGWVHEIRGHDELISAIAKEGAKLPALTPVPTGSPQDCRMELSAHKILADSAASPSSVRDYGYTMTSHSSQGQTANHMLIQVDTEWAATDLLHSRMAYVSVSRRAHDVQLFTNDRDALGHDISKQSAEAPARHPISAAGH